MAEYFRIPFAENGDKATIPSTSAGFEVSFSSGYTPKYEADPDTDRDARFVERDGQNALFFALSSNDKQWYENLYPPFITAAENGGTPFSYKKNMIVSRLGINYISLEDNNQDTPPSAKWAINSRSASLIENDNGGTAQEHFDATTNAHPATAITTQALPELSLTTSQVQAVLLALKNGAISERQSSATDDALNKLLIRGAWGLGGNCIDVTNFNNINRSGFYASDLSAMKSTSNGPTDGLCYVLNLESKYANLRTQIAVSNLTRRVYFRTGSLTTAPWERVGQSPGLLIKYAGPSVPDGAVLANGAAIPRSGLYSDLFDEIGTTYGAGDGSTTFNVPNETDPTYTIYITY